MTKIDVINVLDANIDQNKFPKPLCSMHIS
jgi:hypothetical protein